MSQTNTVPLAKKCIHLLESGIEEFHCILKWVRMDHSTSSFCGGHLPSGFPILPNTMFCFTCRQNKNSSSLEVADRMLGTNTPHLVLNWMRNFGSHSSFNESGQDRIASNSKPTHHNKNTLAIATISCVFQKHRNDVLTHKPRNKVLCRQQHTANVRRESIRK